MKIRIHIERVSVEGMQGGPGAGAALQAALSAELSRLIASDPGLLAGLSNARLPHLALEQTVLEAGPERVGAGVASALHAGLGSNLTPKGQLP